MKRTFVLFAAAALIAQNACAQGSGRNGDRADLFFGRIVTVDESALLDRLRALPERCGVIEVPCAPGEELLKTLFGETRRPNLPDFIVLLEKENDGVWRARRPTLMWGGANTPYVFGARYFYVLVFAPERVPLDARITTQYIQPANPLTSVLAVLGASDAAATEEPDPESTRQPIEWAPLNGDAATAKLWLGTARLPIGLESMNRVTVSFRQPIETLSVSTQDPAPKDAGSSTTTTLKREISGPGPLTASDFPRSDTLGVTGHFSNSSFSRTGFGLGLGVTFDAEDTALAQKQAINGYALAKLYVRRPRLSAREQDDRDRLYRASWAVLFGTNVAADAFEEVVLGASWGHVLGNAGFFFAGNLVREPEGADGGGRKWRFLVGLEYSF